MEYRVQIILVLMIMVGIAVAYKVKQEKPLPIQQQQIQPLPPKPIEPKPEIKPPTKIEPEWKEYLPVRKLDPKDMGKVLTDIESHMPAGHIYKDNDKITWGHETTHGINSNMRMKFSNGVYTNNVWNTICGKPVFHNGRINAFYCLENKAAVIEEPPVTIRQVAAAVPASLRGPVYNLYLVQQAGSWNNTPLYLCDEWVAYTNGSEVRRDLNIATRGETVSQMIEFDVYCLTLAMLVKQTSYDDKQFKSFLIWNIERSMDLHTNEATQYLVKFKTNADAQGLREFTKSYMGPEWSKKILGLE